MGEHEGSAEDFARLAAELGGQSQVRKAELESIHPSEPEPELDSEGEEFVAKVVRSEARRGRANTPPASRGGVNGDHAGLRRLCSPVEGELLHQAQAEALGDE
jgi:hypothetical protein